MLRHTQIDQIKFRQTKDTEKEETRQFSVKKIATYIDINILRNDDTMMIIRLSREENSKIDRARKKGNHLFDKDVCWQSKTFSRRDSNSFW